MEFVNILPTINALLNGTSAVLLVTGRHFVRAHRIRAHRTLMLCAFATSSVFLVLYLLRFYLTGAHRFVGPMWLRTLYLGILSSHMLLAVIVVPLIFRTIFLALRNRISEHRRIVRWTYPIWVYVSVTGVVVYLMLYHLSA